MFRETIPYQVFTAWFMEKRGCIVATRRGHDVSEKRTNRDLEEDREGCTLWVRRKKDCPVWTTDGFVIDREREGG